jgi:hypothetical protein
MKPTSLLVLALFALAATVQAAEPAVVTQPAAPVPVAAPADAQKPVTHPQQQKMRDCNKQASGKKGAERKSFMKTCLSRKA